MYALNRVTSVAVLLKCSTPEIYPKFCQTFGGTICNISPPSWTISLPPKNISWKIQMLSIIFIFWQNFEIFIFDKILKKLAKFLKDSIFRVESFVKLSVKYSRNFRCRDTSKNINHNYKGQHYSGQFINQTKKHCLDDLTHFIARVAYDIYWTFTMYQDNKGVGVQCSTQVNELVINLLTGLYQVKLQSEWIHYLRPNHVLLVKSIVCILMLN